MVRQRKPKDPKSIPLAPPSSTSTRAALSKPLIEISEEEKWRLINQSGILSGPALQSIQHSESVPQPEEEPSMGDEIFNAILLIIPFSGILLLMEFLIRQQYGKETPMEVILERMVPGVPILSLFIFYTTRYKSYRRLQTLLFIVSVGVGCRMLWLLNRSSWLVNMRQCPPLATVWIYTVLQLDLGLAVGSLAAVGSFVWWKGLKILL
ncbi:hypothetical protein HYPSUDRAFT_32020 [Hypholoma sublateritium FD-334 SS-4]|uniref:DUF7719 domain-containing protein n=1 Tax=Hypholoma sublateritium (strain FD-334 SS-4) TaxID=945553 RepID=A0A0D2QEE6_HYPSF|nr:hypothetical protein HYPSUDRAFT_32020 [Hypholoma sublateritium FD-334 SS-4]